MNELVLIGLALTLLALFIGIIAVLVICHLRKDFNIEENKEED